MNLSGLDPEFRPYAQALLIAAGQMRIATQVTSTRRSRSKQKRLWERYQRGEHKYTVLPPGYSLHEIGLAMDVSAPKEQLRKLGKLWLEAGGTWGGEKDPVHFGAPRSWWPTPPW